MQVQSHTSAIQVRNWLRKKHLFSRKKYKVFLEKVLLEKVLLEKNQALVVGNPQAISVLPQQRRPTEPWATLIRANPSGEISVSHHADVWEDISKSMPGSGIFSIVVILDKVISKVSFNLDYTFILDSLSPPSCQSIPGDTAHKVT